MKIKFSNIIGFSAFLVAITGAFYSVYGLSQLFAGAGLAVMIMASSLEFAKVVSVSLLQKYWNRISKALRAYLIIGVCILVSITSAGIYGFLSNAYQKTANAYQISENQITILNNKKSVFDSGLAANQRIIQLKTKRLEQLSDLRNGQELRLNQSKNTSGTRNDINSSTNEIQSLNKDIDDLNKKNDVLLDSSNKYATNAIDAKSNSTATSEIGPLKYLANLTGYPMDKVVNWFILLLIFVFDPLAVALVIAFNKIKEFESEEKVQPKLSKEDLDEIFKNTRLSKSPDMEMMLLPEETKETKEIKEPDRRTPRKLKPLLDDFSFSDKEVIDVDRDIAIDSDEIINGKKLTEIPNEQEINHVEKQEISDIEDKSDELINNTNNETPVIEEQINEPVVIQPEVQVEQEITPEVQVEQEITPEVQVEQEITPEMVSTKAEIETVEPEEIFERPVIEELIEPVVKQTPIVLTGKVELQDIKEVKENRGFSNSIPNPKNNTIQRIGQRPQIKKK